MFLIPHGLFHNFPCQEEDTSSHEGVIDGHARKHVSLSYFTYTIKFSSPCRMCRSSVQHRSRKVVILTLARIVQAS